MTNALAKLEVINGSMVSKLPSENLIDAYHQTGIMRGAILEELKLRREHKAQGMTWEDFCNDVLACGRSQAYREIAAYNTWINIKTSPIGDELGLPRESQIRPLTSLEPSEQIKIWEDVVRTAPNGKITGSHVADVARKANIPPDGHRGTIPHNGNLTNGIATCNLCGELYDGTNLEHCPYCAYTHQQRIDYLNRPKAHVSHNTGNNEWYTPPQYTEAARQVMGSIDVDPASSSKANMAVKASMFYDTESNGLNRSWRGKVWMNPPYAQPAIVDFCKKFAAEIDNGNIVEGITLTNNATETAWFYELSSRCAAVCFPSGRIKFVDPQGKPSGAPLQGQAIMYFGSKVTTFTKAFKKFGAIFHAR